jgi:outer membrane protein OmpA-like peptidoglycan-associated protein
MFDLIAQEIVKVKLSDAINTRYVETKPMISPDGETLFFARQNYPENINGKFDDQDIYMSTLAFAGWRKAVNIGEPLNNQLPNGVVSIAQNGLSLLLLNAYNNNTMQEGVAISHLSDSGWSLPEEVEIKNFHNHSEFVDYFLSANGQEMLIAVERDNSLGDQDLYVSKKEKNGFWSTPTNLGDEVNTKKAEFAPFLAADDRTLFFASYGHEGFGDADIYYTKRLDSTWTNWSVPENLGPEVNTAGFEAYYTIPNDGTIGYYVSSEDGKDGNRDIFSITLPYKFRPEPVILLRGELLHADNTIDSSAFQINFLTDKAIEYEIFVEYKGATFDALLPVGASYFFYISKSGFISESHYIDLEKQEEYEEELANIHTIAIKKGNAFTTHNLQFVDKSAELAPSSYFELMRLLEIFQQNDGLQVALKGHAFDYEDPAKNDSISLARLKYIKDYYVQQGVAEDRLVIEAQGGENPVKEGYKRHINSNFNMNNIIDVTILDTEYTQPVFQDDMMLATANLGSHAFKFKSEYMIQFEFDSDNWLTNEKELGALDSLMSSMQLLNAEFTVAGYTCSIGNTLYNQYLSGMRANSVKKWLIELGVDDRNIITDNRGSSNPIASNATAGGRKKNRRVALTFVIRANKEVQISSN